MTQLSAPDIRGDMYTASFELFPFHEGSSYSFFMGIMNGNGPLRGHFCIVRAMMDKCAKAKDWTNILRTSYEAARLASEFNKLLGYVAVTVQIPILAQVETVSDFSCLFRCLKPHDKHLKPDEFVTIEPFLNGIFQNFDTASESCAQFLNEDIADDDDDLNICLCTSRKPKNISKPKDDGRNSYIHPSSACRNSRDQNLTAYEDEGSGLCHSSAYRTSNSRNYASDDKNSCLRAPSAYKTIDEDFADDLDLGSCLCISTAFWNSKSRDCSYGDQVSDFGSETVSPSSMLGSSHTNMATAFSHFSWHFTRKLLVCNLQGVSNGLSFTMTNPTIHSIGRQFGDDDASTPAILAFFSSHRCSNICRKWDTCRRGGKPQRRVSFQNLAGDCSCLDICKPSKQTSPFLLRNNCLGTLL